VSWKTKLSTIIVTSSTEVERISAAYIPAEIAFLRKLAQELGFVQVSPTIIFEDNNGLLHLTIRVILRGVPSILIYGISFSPTISPEDWLSLSESIQPIK
jgi:hypothetical protein